MVITADGNILRVENIFREELHDGELRTVYNFQVEDFHTYFVGENCVLVHNANDYASPQTKNTSELDIKKIKETKRATLKGNTKIKGGRSGGDRPLEGQPNTYIKTDGGHILVYGKDGRLNLDISPKRVKARVTDYNPDGVGFERDMKIPGPVPPELLKGW